MLVWGWWGPEGPLTQEVKARMAGGMPEGRAGVAGCHASRVQVEEAGSDTLTQACRPGDSGFPTGEPAAEGPREMKVAGPWPSSRPLSLGSSVDTITVLPCVLLENKCL